MRYALLLLACSFLASCATIGRMSDPQYFQKQSSMQLCMDLMSSPSYNVNRQARMDELARRGENCSQFVNMGAVQVERDRANAAAAAAGAAILATPPPQAPVTCRWFAGQYVCQ